ncbi:OMP_RagA_SusC, TonB-linked outer membrane protein, SusC/RagA family [Spirosomataceae bacterium]|jgi:TonB-linked SusC/RagA family outer membrane protein
MKKSLLFLFGVLFCLQSQFVAAQSRAVTGKVTDAGGNGLPGVSVSVKSSTNGAITDGDGAYSVNVPSDKNTLVFSYIGFVSQEVVIGSRTQINVSLAEDATALSEVVVVGYGTQKKSQMTGAISQVSAKQITEMPLTNLGQALQGRAAGVDVSQSGSKPGAAPRILIRGRRSFNAGNDPLYVVDGIPLAAGFEDINPNDVQSMEVLKDATATAIYGARGANGVVLVTTKRGANKGKTTVTLDTYAGASNAYSQLELFNGEEFAEYIREAHRATGLYRDAAGNPVPTGVIDAAADAKVTYIGGDPAVAAGIAAKRNTQYQDLILRTGMMQNHTIGIQGGNEKTSFYISGGFFQDKGITQGLDFTRNSLRANIDHQVNKRLKVGISSYMMYSIRNGENLNPYANTLNANPLGTPFNEDGSLIFEPTGDPLLSNPLAEIVPGAQVDNTKKYRIFNSIFAEVKILDGLSYRFNLGPDFTQERWGRFIGSETNSRRRGDAQAFNENRFGFNITMENILNYNKTFGKHNLNVTGVQSIQRDNFERYRTEVQGIPAEAQSFYSLNSGTNILGVQSDLTQWTIASFMGRVNYSFNDKYLLTATLRRDGSSRFGENTKFGNFPGIAFGWNITNESFMKNVRHIDMLKLRGGWGKVGNQGVRPYQTQGLLARTAYAFGTTAAFGFRPNTISNPDLRWEESGNANVGLDFSVFRGRLQGSLELYETNTKSLLLNDFLPGSTGFNFFSNNVGHTRNKGIELGITTINLNTKNGFKWSTDFQFTKNKEEIVSLYNGKIDDLGNRWFIGQPLNTYFDLKKIGIWQTNEADQARSFGSQVGQIKIEDNNGRDSQGKLTGQPDGRINQDDRVILGNDVPTWSGGLTNRFEFKGFDLSFFLFGRFGNMILSGFHRNQLALAGRYQQIKVDYWTPNNPTNEFPQPRSTQEFPVNNSSLFYFDGSFIKLRNINFGYTFSNTIAKKIGAESVRLFSSIQQPRIWSSYLTKYNGVDPEATITNSPTGLTAITDQVTPSTTVTTFGLNIKF